MKKYISFDVGGTNIKYGILSENGDILEKDKFKTSANGETVLSDLCRIIKKYKVSDDIQGVAFSMPGFIDVYNGVLNTAGALKELYGLNLKKEIESKVGLRVELENDVNCVALAEKWRGNAKDNKNFLCLTVGTGIGGAIFIDNKLYRGKNYSAGEFGYTLTRNFFENEGEKCNLSGTASVASAIRRRYAEETGEQVDSVTGEYVFELAETGHVTARKVIENFYNNLSIGIYNLIFIFNPEKVLIGGAISAREDLLDIIKNKIRQIMSSDVTLTGFELDKIVEIEKCHFQNDSGMLGALYHFFTIER